MPAHAGGDTNTFVSLEVTDEAQWEAAVTAMARAVSCRPGAARFVNGAGLPVDGGMGM